MDGGSLQWDTLFRNALVFDGTGAPPRALDVAVRDGRIVAMATDLPRAQSRDVIDVQGRWLMPGLLDVHTHFDLEVELEPGLPEAVRHGSTTVVVANCSLGLAYGNQRRNGEDPIVDCFARVENVPKSVLRKVADVCNWQTSADYLAHLDQLPLGPNLVTMIPHSMLRVEVMGLQQSVSREPTEAELGKMQALVEKGMEEGYVGFSTDALPFHFLANQPNTHKQIPTQFAPFGELKRLTGVVRRWGRVWQATPPKDDKLAVFRNFLLTSGRLYGRPLKVTAVAAIDITGVFSTAATAMSRVYEIEIDKRRHDLAVFAEPCPGLAGLIELGAPVETLSYEQARSELENVVRQLESGTSNLESSIALWERGEALASRCEAWLEGARERLHAVRNTQDTTDEEAESEGSESED